MTDSLVLPVDPTVHPDPPPAEPEVPRLARVLGVVGRALILAGIVVLLFVVFQLWGTDIQEARAQGDLRDDLALRFDSAAEAFDPALFATPVGAEESEPVAVEAGDDPGDDDVAVLPAPETTEPPSIDEEFLALLFPEDGDALARIEMPSIDVDKVVVRGVAVADLRKGPGHYDQTALPGNPGNSAIAGHRTTYGSPFNRIDELEPGDEITITSVQGDFTYRVLDPTTAYGDDLGRVAEVGAGHVIVDPSAVWVLADFGDDRLTLTACHPKLSSRQRIIVAAELVDDAVEVPEWVVEAEAARQAAATADTGSEADGAGEPDAADPDDDPVLDTDGADAASEPAETTPVAANATPDLDEGLSGERDAIPPAAAWMLAAIVFWWAGGRLGRRFFSAPAARVAARFAGLLPALTCLWFSFELIDRALPAG